MNFEFNDLEVLILLSWLACSSWLGLGAILISGAILFSASIPVNILLLISLTLYSFYIAAARSRKRDALATRYYYFVRLFFLFIALLGAAFQGYAISPLLICLGLLFSLPVLMWSLIFGRHYESLTIRAYIYSVLIPALTTLVVMLKIKNEMKVEWSQTWDILLTVIGLGTLLFGTLLAFLKKKTKGLIIYLTQAWIGLSVFVLVVETTPVMRFALAALCCFTVTAPVLLVLAKQMGKSTERFARVILIGMPGFLGFSSLYYTVRSVSGLNVYWLWVLAIAFLFQVLAMMLNEQAEAGSSEQESQQESLQEPSQEADRWVRIKFAAVILVQLLCSVSFYWLERVGRV